MHVLYVLTRKQS